MNSDEKTKEQFDQPVAYDAEGRPLYAHPPKTTETPPEQPAPQVVHMTRAIQPVQPEISDAVKAKHEASAKQYPLLNLSGGEYIIRAVKRHPIGLFIPMSAGILMLAGVLAIGVNYAEFADSLNLRGDLADPATAFWPTLLLSILIGLGMFIVWYVYVNNKFFLTNESVIQEIQHSLFSRLEQTVSLANIEDASFVQHGIIQYLFNYGSIRLSTEGDETTYRFTYVANPKMHIETLNNAVEAFKNGRPVQSDD